VCVCVWTEFNGGRGRLRWKNNERDGVREGWRKRKRRNTSGVQEAAACFDSSSFKLLSARERDGGEERRGDEGGGREGETGPTDLRHERTSCAFSVCFC